MDIFSKQKPQNQNNHEMKIAVFLSDRFCISSGTNKALHLSL